MAIITRTEVKSLLQISATTWDTLIDSLIPMCQDKIVEYCRNRFLDLNVQIEADTIAFVSASTPLITDSDSGFVTAGFESGMDVLVYGSTHNDGLYNAATVAAGTLSLATTEVLTTEAAGDDVVVTRVRWPKAIKLDAAQLVNYYLHKEGKLVSQEQLPGGYSAQFLTEAAVMKFFDKYRKPYR